MWRKEEIETKLGLLRIARWIPEKTTNYNLDETWTKELIEQELARIHQRLDQHLNKAQPYEGNLVADLAWCYSAALTLLTGEAIATGRSVTERGEVEG